MSESNPKREIVDALGARGLIGALQSVLDRVAGGDAHSQILMQPKMYPEGAPEVIKSIIQVMIKVHQIPKLGRNKVDNYDYVRFVDLAAKLQDALALYNLVMAQRTVKKAVIGKVIFLDFQFDLYHSSGQYILNMMSLPGACRFEFKSGTTDDKSPGKAITAGLKSAVISLFKIPAGVDGDIERESFVDADGQMLNPPERPRARDDDKARDEPRDPPRDPPREPPRGGYDPETGEIRMDPPPRDNPPPRGEWGGPPPGFDDAPPFGGPPEPPSAPSPPAHSGPSRTPPDDDREFRRKVQALSDSLNNARAIAEGDRIWVENADLIRGVSDSTYDYLRNAFEQRWNQPPPAI